MASISVVMHGKQVFRFDLTSCMEHLLIIGHVLTKIIKYSWHPNDKESSGDIKEDCVVLVEHYWWSGKGISPNTQYIRLQAPAPDCVWPKSCKSLDQLK